MLKDMIRRPLISAFAFLAFGVGVSGQTAPPRIFFTDLTSGPSTGGENNNGTILTIYGRNFGVTQGTSTVTVGGGAVVGYLKWGGKSKAATAAAKLETISVAIGPNAKSGTVVVTTSLGVSSCEDTLDGCQFTVRSGNIFCVSTTGSDSNNGNFPSSCWATVSHANSSMSAGDTTYVENGINETANNGFSAVV